MRVTAEGFFWSEANRVERFFDEGPTLFPRRGELELCDRRFENVVDPIERVVDLVRILEDHLDVPKKAPSLLSAQSVEIGSFVENLTGRWTSQPEEQTRERRLSTSAFAD